MSNTLYKASHSTFEITEVEFTKKTASYYWINERIKEAISCNYYKCFDTKDEAVRYLDSLIKLKINSSQNTLQYYERKLDEFNSKYGK